jgi:hypothetical protein
MSFGGVQSMITILKNNRLMKGERKTIYDRKGKTRGVYGATEDHTQMNSHVFAAFQKEQFQKRKKERIRNRRIVLISLLIVIILLVGFLLLWNGYDFDLLFSPEFT